MRKLVSLLSVLLLFSALAYGQTRTITGTVRDANGNPVPFATITEAGTKHATSADANGAFSITVPQNARLIVTSTGFKDLTVMPTSDAVSLTLTKGQEQMAEVVVTALGQGTRKAKVGYSTSTFNSGEITRTAPTNLLDGLSGKIAGANISKTGGPGSSTKVVLRGYGVIGGGNNQPLYVIDGLPFNDSRIGASSTSAASAHLDFGNALNDINPNDIESITVLKGTAASSLYGSAAKNGAIMITTKKGKNGKLRVDFASSVTFSEVGKLPDFQDKFGQGWNATSYNVENGSWGPRLDGTIRPWGSDLGTNSAQTKPFTFVKDNIRNAYETGMEYNNSISLSGGGEGTQFYFSYGNVSSDGVVPTNSDSYYRNTFSARTNSKFNKFTLNTSMNYVNKKQNVIYSGQGLNPAGNSGAFFDEILQIPVDIDIHNMSDYKNVYYNVDNYFTVYAENPYFVLNENKNKQNSDRVFGNFDMGYQITNSLSAQARLGGDFTNARTFNYANIAKQTPGSYNDGGLNNSEGEARTADVGYVQELNNYIGQINGDFLLKYNKNFGDITLDALGGYNYYQEDQKSNEAYITNLVIPGFYNLSNSTIKPTVNDAVSHRKRMGLYGQAIVGYKNQLFLTVNARNDWSSTLPVDDNSFFYPGASLAWTASQTFNLPKAISLLKFRGAYGKTGADASPYLTKNTLVVGDVTLPFGSVTFPFNGTSSYVISTAINNPKLQPIITKEAEVGMEIRFWNRLGIDVSLYDKRTQGQIFAVPIAPSTGSLTLVSNLGEVQNKGIELTLDGKVIDKSDLSWNMIYTFTKNNNEVLELSSGLKKVVLNTATEVELDAYPGHSVSDIYATVPRFDPAGHIIVGAIGVPVPAADKANFGSTLYDYTMGLFNNVRYKNLSLGFSLDYRSGGKMYSRTADLSYFTGNAWLSTYNDRRPFIIPGSVTETIDPVTGKATYKPNEIPYREATYDTYFYASSNRTSIDKRIFDRSFLKLRDVTLSYALPRAWASKIASSGLSVGVYATNILLWVPQENLFVDPESSNLGNDIASEMGEFGTTPQSRSFGISLKASF